MFGIGHWPNECPFPTKPQDHHPEAQQVDAKGIGFKCKDCKDGKTGDGKTWGKGSKNFKGNGKGNKGRTLYSFENISITTRTRPQAHPRNGGGYFRRMVGS